NNIAFKILPSPESNDSEVKILIDGNDFLGDDYLGLDPPVFFNQQTLFQSGELMIGRCTCGCEGCSDYSVTVNVDNDKIIWTNHNGLKLEFNKVEYEKIILEAKNDNSWEDENRKIERLISNLLHNTKTKDGYNFNWASARIKNDFITLSFSKNGEQKLLEFSRDKTSLDNTLINANKFSDRQLK
ncbi:MAG: hypothetical protein ACXVED_18165, partial [Bacteroidia bacterium]